MTGEPDVSTLRRIAIATILAYAVAFVLILVGFALGSQRAVVGSGFLVGGLATLGSLVLRLLGRPAPRRQSQARGRRAPAFGTTPLSGTVIRSVAALVMLWIGVSFLIRPH